MKRLCLLCFFVLCSQTYSYSWGFFAHKKINRLAVFTLPYEMMSFYKYYIVYISENSIRPDARRYTVEGEAPKHYIDIDVYDEYFGGKGQAILKMPRNWKDAVLMFTEDTLQQYGIVPWHINRMKYQLTRAFEQKNVKEILRLSTEIGHYIGDANVPLHTTQNYNGQFSNQKGIHGFWESRLPELFFEEYDFFTGKAVYIDQPQSVAWEAVINAHLALDSVLYFEEKLTYKFPESKKYTFDERNYSTIRTYSKSFSEAYHQLLDGQVERQMRASVKMLGDFWFTCWVDAGQPDLALLLDKAYLEELEKERKEEEEKENPIIPGREHDYGLSGFGDTGNFCCSNPYLTYYQQKIKLNRTISVQK